MKAKEKGSIKWGLQAGFASGESKLANRICYGYMHDADGALVPDPPSRE